MKIHDCKTRHSGALEAVIRSHFCNNVTGVLILYKAERQFWKSSKIFVDWFANDLISNIRNYLKKNV